MAKALGKKEDYDFFSQRARAYTSLFDPATKLMRGKDSQGKWRDPFDPFRLSHAGTSGGIIPKAMHGSMYGMCNTM